MVAKRPGRRQKAEKMFSFSKKSIGKEGRSADGAGTAQTRAPKDIPFVEYPETLKPVKYDSDIFAAYPQFKEYELRTPRATPLNSASDDLVAYVYSSYTDTGNSGEPEIFMYGTTEDAETVCLRVTGFLPYCYVALPTEYLEVFSSPEDQMRLARTFYTHISKALKRFIEENEDLRKRYANKYGRRPMVEPLALDNDLDEILTDARDLKMYNRETRRLLKVTVAEPQLIPLVKELLWFPEGFSYHRCTVCQFNCRYGIQERDLDEPVMKHHKNCPALVHVSCAERYGRERKAQAGLANKWFSACQYCNGFYSRERLCAVGSTGLEFKSVRDTIYGAAKVYNHHDWISDFLAETREFGRELGRPLSVAMDDWVQRQRIEKNGHLPQLSSFTVYNADIPFTARAMADADITHSWVKVRAGRWARIPSASSKTLASVEAACHWRSVKKHECSLMPELLQMSLDEEMRTAGVMCQHSKDPVLQVPILITNYRTGKSKTVLFAIGSLPEHLGQTRVFSYPYTNDEEMANAERQMIREVCIFSAMVMPNVVMTHNGTNFDIPYFVRRGVLLGVPEVRSFLSWRRGSEGDLRWKQDVLRGRESTCVTIKGIFFFDLYYWAIKKLNGADFSEFNLNTLSWLLLRQKKNDIDASYTARYQATARGREILGRYAIQDVMLVQLICDKKKLMQALFTEAAMLGVTAQENCESGNNKLMGIALFRYASLVFSKELGIMCVFPTPRKKMTHPDDKPDKYTGAVVIEPRRGYYRQPVATLDFSSLYPSIMREKNLCQSTFLEPEVIEFYRMSTEQYWRRPTHKFVDGDIIEVEDEHNPVFMAPGVYYGFIPRFQKFMTDERKRVRSRSGGFESKLQDNIAKLKSGTLSPEDEKVLEAENRVLENELQVIDVTQNSYKTLSNSVYGLMGLNVSTYYREAIAETITLTGQDAVMRAKSVAEKHFTKANGYSGNLKVIYGDTDSIMCILEDCDYIDHAGYLFSLMFELSAMIKTRYTVLDMQPEKLYLVFKLSGKKNYMGVKMDLTGGISMDIKGFRFKKKNSNPIQRETCKYIFEEGLRGGDVDAAVNYVQKQLVRIHTREASTHDLAVSGCFSKSFLGAEDQNAPMVAAQRMYDRTGQVVQPTERLRYIVLEDKNAITGRDCLGTTERAEQALYAEFNNLLYDAEYYKEDLIKTVIPLLLHLVPKSRGGHDEKLLHNMLLDHPVLRSRARRPVTGDSAIVRAFSGGVDQHRTKCGECGCAMQPSDSGSRYKKRPFIEVEFESDAAADTTPCVGSKRALGPDADVPPSAKRHEVSPEIMAPCLPDERRDACARFDAIIARVETDPVRGVYAINHLSRVPPEEPVLIKYSNIRSAATVCAPCTEGKNGDLHERHHAKYKRLFSEMIERWNECSGCTFGLVSGTSLTNCVNDNCPNWDKRRKATKAYLAESHALGSLFE